MTPFKHIRVKVKVPLIDEIYVHLIITTDIIKSHQECGIAHHPENCVMNGGEVHMEQGWFDCYIFLRRNVVTHNMIGHELHHALHEICDRIGQNPSNNDDELTARIAGFLNGWTYLQLEKAGIPVTHKPQKNSAPFAQI